MNPELIYYLLVTVLEWLCWDTQVQFLLLWKK